MTETLFLEAFILFIHPIDFERIFCELSFGDEVSQLLMYVFDLPINVIVQISLIFCNILFQRFDYKEFD